METACCAHMGSGAAPTASSVMPRRAAGVTAGGRRSASEVVAPLDLRDHVAELVDVRLKRGKQTGNRRPPSISLAALDVGEGGERDARWSTIARLLPALEADIHELGDVIAEIERRDDL